MSATCVNGRLWKKSPRTAESSDFPFITLVQNPSQKQRDFERATNVHFWTNRAPAPIPRGTGRHTAIPWRGCPLDTKPLPPFGGGVFELRERFDSNAYRLMYVVALRKAVYVLHAFMKKSKSGIGLPKPDAELIELRLRRAQSLDAEE